MYICMKIIRYMNVLQARTAAVGRSWGATEKEEKEEGQRERENLRVSDLN